MNEKRFPVRHFTVTGILLATLIAAHPASASLNTVVLSTADSGPGSLREAIATASPGSVITFGNAPIPNPVILLTSGPLKIDKDLIIDGSAWPGLTIDGNLNGRVIHITTQATVTLKSLIITHGNVDGPCSIFPSDGAGYAGGGVYAVGGHLEIVNSAIVSNTARCGGLFSGGNGGGVASGGTVIVRDSTISHNVVSSSSSGAAGVSASRFLMLINTVVEGNNGYSAITAYPRAMIERSKVISNTNLGIDAGTGGTELIVSNSIITSNDLGIASDGFLTVTNSLIGNNAYSGINSYGQALIRGSTVSGNQFMGISNNGQLSLVNSTVSNNAGGIIQFRFGESSPQANIASSTIVSNTSYGITVYSGTLWIANSILASNGITTNFVITGGANLVSLGYNLSSSTDILSGTGDLTGTLPALGPLQNNGGPTPTHALLPGSPGIDAGNPAGCLDVDGTALFNDQRGNLRASDGTNSGVRRCDIGAFEFWIPTQSLYMPYLPIK